MTTLQVIHLSALAFLSIAVCIGLQSSKKNVSLGPVGFGIALAVVGLGLSLRQPGSISSVLLLDSDSAYARTYVIGLSFALGALLRIVYWRIKRALVALKGSSDQRY